MSSDQENFYRDKNRKDVDMGGDPRKLLLGLKILVWQTKLLLGLKIKLSGDTMKLLLGLKIVNVGHGRRPKKLLLGLKIFWAADSQKKNFYWG